MCCVANWKVNTSVWLLDQDRHSCPLKIKNEDAMLDKDWTMFGQYGKTDFSEDKVDPWRT